MKQIIVTIALFAAACGTPTAPTAITKAPAVREMAYAINVPSFPDLQVYRTQYPSGLRVNPLDAQRRWDYSSWYGGTPNVYYGQTAPKCQNYFNTSIVIAPRGVAGLDQFTAADWPEASLDAGITYVWSGYFIYSVPAPPGSHVIADACR